MHSHPEVIISTISGYDAQRKKGKIFKKRKFRSVESKLHKRSP